MAERLVVITLKAVSNDDSLKSKEEIKTSPLKAAPKLARSAVHSAWGQSMAQLFLSTMVPAPTAEMTRMKEQACAGNTETLAKCPSPPS